MVYHTALLELLGGEDLLSLMINANDFYPLYSNGQGLRFTFYGQGEKKSAYLYPMAYNAHSLTFTNTSISPPIMYMVNMEIKPKSSGKLLNSMIVYTPQYLKSTFEVGAEVALSFDR